MDCIEDTLSNLFRGVPNFVSKIECYNRNSISVYSINDKKILVKQYNEKKFAEREKSFREITKDNPINSRLKLLSVDKMNDKCPSCEVKYFCGGFCRGETYANTGNLNSPYVRCQEYKEGILEAMWELSANPDLYEEKAREFLENSKENGNK